MTTRGDNFVLDDDSGGNSNESYSYDLGGGTVVERLDSTNIYEVDVLLGDGSTITVNNVRILQMQNGDTFLVDSGTELDGLAITGFTPRAVEFGGANFTGTQADYTVTGASVTCFCDGTLITTPDGPRKIEDLRAGDFVTTQDNGLQKILAILCRPVPADAKHQPIEFRQGSLGDGLPKRTLRLSPQHRLRISGPDGPLWIAAKAFLARPEIVQNPAAQGVKHWHIICQNHEAIYAEGCPVETLYSGPETLKSLRGCAATELCRERLQRVPMWTLQPSLPMKVQREVVMSGPDQTVWQPSKVHHFDGRDPKPEMGAGLCV